MTQPAPTPPLTLPQLEDELLGLAGHLAAAQSRFLTLLAEFDDRAGWAGPGLRSCAHWLTWRIGMSLRTAHEHVRVAHALRRLPLIAAAFAQGRISYSKVRAITRVTVPPATVSADLAAVEADDPASGSPASDSATGPSGAAAAGDTATGDTETADTAVGDAAVADAAAEGRSAVSGATSAGGVADRPAPAPRLHDAPVDAERTLLDLALAGTASHVETVVRATRRLQADPGRLSARRSLTWRWADDGSLVVAARLTPADGAALISAIDAATAPAPAPSRRPVAAPPDWRKRSEAEYPGSATDRLAARRADVLVAMVTTTGDLDAATDPGSGTRPETADSGADTGPGPAAEQHGRRAAVRTAVQRGRADVVVHIDVADGTASIVGGPEIAPATAERLACDARAQVLLEDGRNRLYLGRRRRLASPAQIAALTVRDSGRCRFAGCTRERHLQAHHVVHWLRAGRTDLDNLVLLCGFHHTLVHERGYGIRRSATGWESVRPDGTPVPAVGAPLVGDVERLIEMQTRAELRIEPDGLTPTWGGERLDRHAILAHLLPPAGDDGIDDAERSSVAA
ncbi:DUF222 domain-containing protein [Pseudonocardia petroleophila]|uniref:DUF222 domain-containing protein n=1 Tax=Pseudonocardia petroleophila TaxID=37331 RepID=A0A7G7MDE9_9PSEU|nr:HNH endonuclease signature motif containing protein [Pseudonocardia petroleophila]QNG50810.1 DUF222 domain-containing protein [Pseudonocardia petroleophila]